MPPIVTLRPIALAEVPALYAAIVESREQVAPWLPDLRGVRSEADVERWAVEAEASRRAGTSYQFVIASLADGRVLGACGLTSLNPRHRFANLYYWVRTSATGQGVASAAARLAARFGLRVAGLNRVEIVVDVDNAASRRVAEKAGAVCEGRLRNRLAEPDGTPRDAWMFSLTPADFDQEAE